VFKDVVCAENGKENEGNSRLHGGDMGLNILSLINVQIESCVMKWNRRGK